MKSHEGIGQVFSLKEKIGKSILPWRKKPLTMDAPETDDFTYLIHHLRVIKIT
jgi:hypothetical protein